MKAWKIVLNLIHGLLNVSPQLVRPQIHEEMNAFKNTSHKYSSIHKEHYVSKVGFQLSAVSVLSSFANSSVVHLPSILSKHGQTRRLPNQGRNYK